MKLDGPIDATRVNAWWPERASLFADPHLDLQAVTTVDSSGLAFLVHWAKACRATGQALCLQGAPRQLRGMLALYAVEPLFELAPTPSENGNNN